MSIRIPLAAAGVALGLTACASSTSSTETAPIVEPPVQEETAPIAAAKPTGIDASNVTQWFAVEKLWPEEPYLGVANSTLPNDDSYGLRFVCDIDTAEVSGILEFQPAGKIGQNATFGLKTSDGIIKDLKGFYQASEDGGAEFVFPVNWITIKDIAVAERSDFFSPDGASELAIVAADYPQRTGTKLLISNEGLNDQQTQLYYYCNPK